MSTIIWREAKWKQKTKQVLETESSVMYLYT